MEIRTLNEVSRGISPGLRPSQISELFSHDLNLGWDSKVSKKGQSQLETAIDSATGTALKDGYWMDNDEKWFLTSQSKSRAWGH